MRRQDNQSRVSKINELHHHEIETFIPMRFRQVLALLPLVSQGTFIAVVPIGNIEGLMGQMLPYLSQRLRFTDGP